MHKESIWTVCSLFAICILAYSTMLPSSYVGVASQDTSNAGGLAYASTEASTKTPTSIQPINAIGIQLNGGSLTSGTTVTSGKTISYTHAGTSSDTTATFLLIEVPGSASAQTTEITIAPVLTMGSAPTASSTSLPVKKTAGKFAYTSITAADFNSIVQKSGAGWYRIHAHMANTISSQDADVYLFVQTVS